MEVDGVEGIDWEVSRLDLKKENENVGWLDHGRSMDRTGSSPRVSLGVGGRSRV